MIAIKHRAGSGQTVHVANWLGLAAAPTFAIMALLVGAFGPNMICTVDASPLGGMVPMYLLMSAFHAGPWLSLIASHRSDAA